MEIHVCVCLHLAIKRKLWKFTYNGPEREGWDRNRDVIPNYTVRCILLQCFNFESCEHITYSKKFLKETIRIV